MLVISRKPNESFRIGDDIIVSIVDVSGDRVKIGIEAPRTTPIVRTEVLDTKKSNIDAIGVSSKIDIKAITEKLNKHKSE